MNAILGALTVLAVGWLGTLMFDVKVGLYAGVLASLYPGAIAMSILILSEGPFCLFMILELIALYLCFLAPAEQVSRRGWVALLLGAFAALAVLIRPSWLLYTPALLGVVCLCGGQQRRQKLLCYRLPDWPLS